MTSQSQNIIGIILAAGSASRMGRTKQTLPFQGKPILSHVIENALAANLSRVIVIIGHDAKQIKKEIDFSKVLLVENKAFAKGQSESIKAGLNAISSPCDGAMFLLGDQPLVDKSIINILILKFYESNAPIIIPFYKEKRGNPVIFSDSLFPELHTLSRDTGARVLFKEYQTDIHKVIVNHPGILIDVDTPQDYQNLVK
ncbi:MAG: molybdenum cofactor cytidylyltransferase [Desulfobacteraceae bacterium]|nr:molybdenum cofactor cytidylyltransferase [Desulfobacteraceae bacterium]